MRPGWMLLAWGLVACGSNSARPGVDAGGGGTGTTPDAASLDAASSDAASPDATVDAAVPLVEVHGIATDLHVSSPGTPTPVAQDLSAYDLQAYVPDTRPSGFSVINAALQTTKFAIPGVPGGSYYLRVVAPGDPIPHFYQTASRSLDLGVTALGRVDGPLATQPTQLTLHLTGVDPVQEGDVFFIDSFSTAGETFAGFVPPLDTSLALDLDWVHDMARAPLLDAARGDDLFVCQRREADGVVPGSFQRTIVDAFSTHEVTLTNGGTAEVTGTFEVPEVTGDQVFQLAPALYRQGHDVELHQPLAIIVQLFAGLSGAVSQGPPIAALRQKVVASQAQISHAVSFHDPFPASWQRSVFAQPSAQWRYAVRGTTTSTSYQTATFERMPASSPLKIGPRFAAPHAIKVGGNAANQAQAVPFDGTHPVTIEWAPVAGVSHYTVRAMQLIPNRNLADSAIATFDTTTSAATMPAQLFQVGGSYVFAVATVVDPSTDYAGGILRRQGFPISVHEAVTARLLFASSCGNGVVDAPFEQCDSGGIATASCNPDCTKTMCGDGFANAAASEPCDDVVDSVACNADCTPAACGDGHVHPLRGGDGGETCDDGNLTPGDGCSADCLVEPGFSCSGEPGERSVCKPTVAAPRGNRKVL